MLQPIFDAYGLKGNDVDSKPFGTGLINHTWMVCAAEKKFILQRINQQVFKAPADIAANIRMIGNYLKENFPGYLFVTAEKTMQQQDLVFDEHQGYFRLFPFVKNSHTVDVVNTPQQAYEAAKQFGHFTRLLAGFPTKELQITLPDFHNLPLRYQQFNTALLNGDPVRIQEAAATILFLHFF